ncbi:Transmembrane protein [Senna tora]|uniref:Transmembrane protein n=1 Tax=Senna tora TaxID=362788 RepID=A0A834W2A0_9FABA|nr:Transmembrane protein [Senna tora]
MSSFIASPHRSFLPPFTHKPISKSIKFAPKFISCRYPQDHDHLQDSPRKNENKLAKLAMVALAAGVLTLGSVHDAYAAKSGGRVGGQAFKSSAPRSAPRINRNSRRSTKPDSEFLGLSKMGLAHRTNIYVNPPVAPPLVGGYGYGFGVPFYGGWGWSPFSFFAPGPSVAIGIGGGFETIVLFLFLGVASAVIRRFFGSRFEDDDDDDY